jgi:PBZ domain
MSSTYTWSVPESSDEENAEEVKSGWSLPDESSDEEDVIEEKEEKSACKYGKDCTNSQEEHRKSFYHVQKPVCKYGAKCYQGNRYHLAEYWHPERKE